MIRQKLSRIGWMSVFVIIEWKALVTFTFGFSEGCNLNIQFKYTDKSKDNNLLE